MEIDVCCSGEPDKTPAHDAFTRLLIRRPSDTETLWQEVSDLVDKFSLRAFVRLEVQRWETGKSWHETKLSIIWDAVKHFCRKPDLLRATSA